jgi:gas vesicle protein
MEKNQNKAYKDLMKKMKTTCYICKSHNKGWAACMVKDCSKHLKTKKHKGNVERLIKFNVEQNGEKREDLIQRLKELNRIDLDMV